MSNGKFLSRRAAMRGLGILGAGAALSPAFPAASHRGVLSSLSTLFAILITLQAALIVFHDLVDLPGKALVVALVLLHQPLEDGRRPRPAG